MPTGARRPASARSRRASHRSRRPGGQAVEGDRPPPSPPGTDLLPTPCSRRSRTTVRERRTAHSRGGPGPPPTALGFRDPKGAFRHLQAPHRGVSRRRGDQRHLLPAMLSWFADEAETRMPGCSPSARSATSWDRRTGISGCCATRDRQPSGWPTCSARSRFAADLLEQARSVAVPLRESGGVQPRSRAEIFQRIQVRGAPAESLDDAVLAAPDPRRTELFPDRRADLEGQAHSARPRCRPVRPGRR